MASALERVNAAWATRGTTGDVERRFNIDGWVSDYLLPANQVTFGGNTYPFGLNQTFLGTRTQEISSTLPGYLAALRMCPPAFAAQMVRALVLSQARFIFRNTRRSARNPGKLFGTQALAPLETPWPNGTTGELLARMEWHAGLAGNAYVTNRQPGRLRVLRPDWVVIVYGSQQEPDDAAHALDGEILGYAYCNGGIAQGRNRVTTLLPDELSHWSPLPDPEGAGIGMSWLTPAIREIQGDRAATDHKLQFFANGATPSLVVKGVTAASKEQFDEIVNAMESNHAGLRNAYRTLYLAAGADATVVGANLKDLDLKSVNGSAETRISMLSRVHPTILGASEGLSGSSLNAGNFSSARRMWADSWIYPTLQDVAAALAPLIRVPADAELWTTTTDMPILREDAKDAADIQAVEATTINTLVTAGFTKDSIIAAVTAQDMSLLVDSGLVSVQLQPPGSAAGTPVPPEAGGATGPKVPTLPPAARAVERRRFNVDEPRIPGGEHGGEWGHGPGGAIKDALKLAGRINLDSGETLVSSRRVDFNDGAAKLAVTEAGGHRSVRLGLGGGGFIDDPWRAAPKGLTVKLSEQGARDLADSLDAAAKKAKAEAAVADQLWKTAEKTTDPVQHAAAMKAADDAVAGFVQPAATITSEWGELRVGYRVHDVGHDVVVGVRPTNAPAAWDLENALGEYNAVILDDADRGRLTKALRAAVQVGGGPRMRSSGDLDDEPDEATFALIAALAWFDDEEPGATRDATFEQKHHRGPGGKFASMVDRLINAIAEHKGGGGKGHPFEGFDREQLRRAAKARGIEIKRGEDRESIAAKLLADLGGSAKTPAGTGSALDLSRVDPQGAQHAALNRYGSDGGYVINTALREGKPLSPRNQTTVDELDALMHSSPLAESVVVHRLVSASRSQFGDNVNNPRDLTGFTWQDKAFVSTSAIDRSAGANYQAISMKITVPAGTPAISHPKLLDDDEVLLGRGLTFTVTADHGKDDRSVRRLDVEVKLLADLGGSAKTSTAKKATKATSGGKVQPVRGKDVTTEREVVSAAVSSAADAASADQLMAGLAKQIGFDGKPEVAADDRLRQEVKNGGVEVFRGVQPVVHYGDVVKTPETMIGEYRDGPVWYGHGGGANGIYATTDHASAKTYAGAKGATMRMVLRADARTIDPKALRRLYDDWHAKHADPDHVMSDPGRFAMALGYDAIVADVFESKTGERYVVVLNRTATLVGARP